MKTQVEVTESIKELSKSIEGEGFDLIKNIKKKVLDIVKPMELDSEKERKIRWKRTAEEVVKDKYFYKGKGCTDVTIVLMALAKAKGIDSKFVKLYSIKRKMLHSVVELTINNNQFYYDMATDSFEEANKKLIFGEYKVYKKGKDSWNVGLKCYQDGEKLYKKLGIS